MNVRLRNLLAGRDAFVKSMEQDKEKWTKDARVGYISLEEHLAEMANLRNEKDERIANVYIHAALSLEKKLVVMLYKEGSHEIPEEKIFRDSLIECFTADRAPLYVALEKDLEEYFLQRQACWQHARHYLTHLSQTIES